MLIQNLVMYEDQYAVRVNADKDSLFYYFDYDVRSADINMQFQHFHTFYEIYIALCPSSTHFLEGKPYELRTFDIIGIQPNALHMTRYPEGEPCRRLIIQFSLPPQVAGLSNEYQQLLSIFQQETPIFRFDSETRTKVYSKLNDIFLLAQKKDPIKNLMIHVKFIEFLTLIFLNQDQNQYIDETEMSAATKKLYAVAAYIHAHYTEPLSLELLSQKFYISSFYLSHQFRQITGFTLTDYIQMTRIRNVQALLINTRMPVTEAALRSGFSSFSQFNRVFQKHIGMSPTQYRRQFRVPISSADI